MTCPPLLHIEALTAGHGKLDVLDDVSLSVAPGTTACVLGPAGEASSEGALVPWLSGGQPHITRSQCARLRVAPLKIGATRDFGVVTGAYQPSRLGSP